MRDDTLKRHMKTHEKKPYVKEEAGISRSGECDEMGKNKQVETMRSDNLKRHMKTHEKKQCSIDDVNEQIEYNFDVNVVALKKQNCPGC